MVRRMFMVAVFALASCGTQNLQGGDVGDTHLAAMTGASGMGGGGGGGMGGEMPMMDPSCMGLMGGGQEGTFRTVLAGVATRGGVHMEGLKRGEPSSGKGGVASVSDYRNGQTLCGRIDRISPDSKPRSLSPAPSEAEKVPVSTVPLDTSPRWTTPDVSLTSTQ